MPSPPRSRRPRSRRTSPGAARAGRTTARTRPRSRPRRRAPRPSRRRGRRRAGRGPWADRSRPRPPAPRGRLPPPPPGGPHRARRGRPASPPPCGARRARSAVRDPPSRCVRPSSVPTLRAARGAVYRTYARLLPAVSPVGTRQRARLFAALAGEARIEAGLERPLLAERVVVGLEALRGDAAADGAAGLGAVCAVREPALRGQLLDVGERPRDVLRGAPEAGRTDAGRIDRHADALEDDELPVRGGVAAGTAALHRAGGEQLLA